MCGLQKVKNTHSRFLEVISSGEPPKHATWGSGGISHLAQGSERGIQDPKHTKKGQRSTEVRTPNPSRGEMKKVAFGMQSKRELKWILVQRQPTG